MADFQASRVEPDIRPVSGEGPVQELADPLVNVLAELGDGALGDAGEPHGLDKLVDPTGGHAADPGLLDYRHKGLLRGPPWLEDASRSLLARELARVEGREEERSSPREPPGIR